MKLKHLILVIILFSISILNSFAESKELKIGDIEDKTTLDAVSSLKDSYRNLSISSKSGEVILKEFNDIERRLNDAVKKLPKSSCEKVSSRMAIKLTSLFGKTAKAQCNSSSDYSCNALQKSLSLCSSKPKCIPSEKFEAENKFLNSNLKLIENTIDADKNSNGVSDICENNNSASSLPEEENPIKEKFNNIITTGTYVKNLDSLLNELSRFSTSTDSDILLGDTPNKMKKALISSKSKCKKVNRKGIREIVKILVVVDNYRCSNKSDECLPDDVVNLHLPRLADLTEKIIDTSEIDNDKNGTPDICEVLN